MPSFVRTAWNKLVKPGELTEIMARHELSDRETKGIRFAGFRKGGFKTKVGGKPTIAYIGYAIKETLAQRPDRSNFL